MRQQAIITPDSRLTASLSAAQNGGKVAHTVRRYGATEQLHSNLRMNLKKDGGRGFFTLFRMTDRLPRFSGVDYK